MNNITYRGRPVADMSRKELIEAIGVLLEMHQQQTDRFTDYMEMTRKFREARRS